MVEVSIICLINKSAKMVDKFFQSLMLYTPMIKERRAEFFFIANNPTKKLIAHLKKNKYPFILNNKIIEENLYKEGYEKKQYIEETYEEYKHVINKAHGDKILFVNCDTFFSKDWLENLIKYSSYSKIVCSTLVEPSYSIYEAFPPAKKAYFGKNTYNYNNGAFQTYANLIKRTGIKPSVAYMPCLFHKDTILLALWYFKENINAMNNKNNFYEYRCFFDYFNKFEIKSYTALDSIVYHLKDKENISFKKKKSKYNIIHQMSNYAVASLPEILNVNLIPCVSYDKIMCGFLSKISIVIYDYGTIEELNYQIEMFKNQTYRNIEIVVIKNGCLKVNSDFIAKVDNVKFYDFKSNDLMYKIYLTIFQADGAYFMFSSPKTNYPKIILEEYMKFIISEKYKINAIMANFNSYEKNKMVNNSLLLIFKNLIIENMPFILNMLLNDCIVETDLKKLKGFNELSICEKIKI